MRLFLASQDFGRFSEELLNLVGKNRKTLLIRNAIDDKEPRISEHKIKFYSEFGLKVKELDLRNYFNQEQELKEFIDNYGPGLIILSGGNTFILRRALTYSGFDKILKKDLKQDKYVLAGYSAGAIVCGPSLKYFERMGKEKLIPEKYKKDIIWEGLNLTKTRIIPHADNPKYQQKVVYLRKDIFDKQNLPYQILTDDDVYVVNNDKERFLEYKK